MSASVRERTQAVTPPATQASRDGEGFSLMRCGGCGCGCVLLFFVAFWVLAVIGGLRVVGVKEL